jgi:magnesium-transporting ATPase (P-type)
LELPIRDTKCLAHGRDSFKNKYFVIAEAISITATLGICYVPITAQMFSLVPLTLTDLFYVFAVAVGGFSYSPKSSWKENLVLEVRLRLKA